MSGPAQQLGGELVAKIDRTGGGARVTLSGAITELADFSPLKGLNPMTLELSGIVRLNSLGVRAWCNFVRDCEAAGVQLTFERCSPVLVEQLAMISNFFGARSRIASLVAPYYCEMCGTESSQLVDAARLDVAPTTTCSKCGKQAIVDVPEDMYSTLRVALEKRTA